MPEAAGRRIPIVRMTLVLSAVCFLCSLTQKCYCTDTGSCGDSVMAFLLGIFGLFGVITGKCIGGICWLANPAFFIAWFLLTKRPKLSLIFSGVALGLSLLFLLIGSEFNFETGRCNTVITFRAGYWLWTISSAILFAGSFLHLRSAEARA